jgi:hypothetical protein
VNVLILALGAVRPDAAARDAELAVAQGNVATVVITHPQAVPDLGTARGVHLIDLTAAAERHPVRRLERLVVYRFPLLATRGLRKLSRMAAVTRGLSRPARGAYRLSRAGDRLHRRGVRRFERAVGSRLRPVLLRRSAGFALVREVDIARFDLVVVSDPQSLLTAWHIARRYPQVPVRLRMPATRPTT